MMTVIVPPIVRFWLFAVFGYYTISVKGKKAPISEAPISLISPHSNVMDSWMLSLFTWGSSMSRIENASLPVIGDCLKSCEPIWVDRDSNKGSGTVDEVIKRIKSPGLWIPVVIFPEGTVHNNESVIGFKTGAFRPGVPVQPLLFRFSEPAFGIWSHYGPSLPATMLLVMCQWRNYCEVEYLPVYKPSEAEKKDAQLYAMNVQKVMAKGLNKPMTDYSLEDLRLLQTGTDAGLPKSTALLEYGLVNRIFGARLPALVKILNRFIQMNTSKSGVVSRDEFLSDLQWPVAEHANLLFAEYDTCSDTAELRYREYVVGTLDLVVKVPGGDNIATTAFKVLSGDGAHITASTMLNAMHQLGYKKVSKGGVEKFLYRVSQSNDLSADGFSSHVEANPDVKVLLYWLLNGTDQF